MSRLLIVGAGGHGKVVAEAALASTRWREIAFLDGRVPRLSRVLEWPVIGADSEASRFLSEYPEIFVAIGENQLRLRLMSCAQNVGFALPTVVHPMTWVSPSSYIGAGCVLAAASVVGADVVLGQGCIINTGATVDHDCSVGDGVHISPGAHVGGNVKIGPRTWIGIGATIRHGVVIGADVVVGAGAAVVESLGDRVKAV